MRTTQAFTLLEILVVIGILSVLAAITFSAFATARNKAHETTCISNMRQIAQVYQMYRQDYDGKDTGTNYVDFGLPPLMSVIKLDGRPLDRRIFLCPNRSLAGFPDDFYKDEHGNIIRMAYSIWASFHGVDCFRHLSEDPTWPIVSCDLHDLDYWTNTRVRGRLDRFPMSIGVSLNGTMTRRPLAKMEDTGIRTGIFQ